MTTNNEVFFAGSEASAPQVIYDDATSSEFSLIENNTEDETFSLVPRSRRRGGVGPIEAAPAIVLATTEPIEIPNEHRPLQAMDTLKPPGYHQQTGESVTDSSNSPPRSNSVDLSTLRRDIELWSISSGEVSENGSDNEFEPATPAESVRTVRSRSHDPTQSPDHPLRRSSRIEHLSEIFRCAKGETRQPPWKK